MTKSELIERIAEEAGLAKGRAEMVVNTVFDAMLDALASDEGIEIRGFGSFSVRQYKAYEGRNPRTGELVHVAPKRLPFFKVGKELRERVNGGEESELDDQGESDGKMSSTKAAKSEGKGNAQSGKRSPNSRRRDEKLSEDVI